MKNHYICLVHTDKSSLQVNVFTESTDKEVIKTLAIKETIKFLDELEVSYSLEEIKAIGYKKESVFHE